MGRFAGAVIVTAFQSESGTGVPYPELALGGRVLLWKEYLATDGWQAESWLVSDGLRRAIASARLSMALVIGDWVGKEKEGFCTPLANQSASPAAFALMIKFRRQDPFQ